MQAPAQGQDQQQQRDKAARPKGRKKRQRPTAGKNLFGRKYVRLLQKHLPALKAACDHPNRVLHFDDLLIAYLYGFFNPTCRSLRSIEDLSQLPPVQQQIGVERLCRSTLSDATRCFDPQLLQGLVDDLSAKLPELKKQDRDLQQILQDVIAADGSFFAIASDVAWAMHHRGRDGQEQGRVRLNFQLDVLRWLPRQFSVSGQAEGSETAAAAKLLEPGKIYLLDRNFVDFEFLKIVLGVVGCDFVLRAQENKPLFSATKQLPLSQTDQEHGVLSDQTGYLPGSQGAEAPKQLLRELIIVDPETGQAIRVLTSLLDLPAYIIGLLYRKRWQIELFFRWLKVWCNFEHLLSYSQSGLRLQFYVAVLGVLLMYLRTGGASLSKYAYNLLAMVASGAATLDQILPILRRREREKELEKQRLLRNKQQQSKKG